MKITAQFVPTLLIAGVCVAQSSTRDLPRPTANYVLHCKGVSSAFTSLKQSGPQATTEKSTDELRIARNGTVLSVQVNVSRYGSMDQHTKRILENPDPYKIVAETGEGLVAIFVNGSTTMHTLTINRALTYGIWTESGFSFLDPQSEPISSTVSLTCAKDKE